MWKIQVIEFMQANGVWVVFGLAFVMALSVSGYWVAKPINTKTSILGVLFSLVAFVGVCVMVINLKIGFSIALVGYWAKSILLFRNKYGIGSFVRPLLYFKQVGSISNKNQEDVLDLF